MNATEQIKSWWSTSIIDMAPGRIRLRGRPIEELIGQTSMPSMIWYMVRGNFPSPGEEALLEAALVSGVDHGPQAPSIAAARMAVTCGLGLNGALASAVNMLDDVHGGAGEQAVQLFLAIDSSSTRSVSLDGLVREKIEAWQQLNGKYLPGFGHRFHNPTDPRAPRLMDIVKRAAEQQVVSGRFADIAEACEKALLEKKGAPVPMNIDGATAVIYAELGFPAPLARGLFCLSRSIGILAHAWEQMEQGGRNKGPTPPDFRWKYTGENPIEEG